MANTKIPAELSSTPSISDGGNATAITIDSSENVGIKEGSPSATLHTNSGTGNIGIHQESTDSGSYISFSDNSTTSISHVLLGAVGNDLVFNAGDTARLRILSGGNVGINTDSPFSPLHISKTNWSSGAPYGTVATIEGNNLNDANWGHLVITDTTTSVDNGGSIRFATGSTSSLNPFSGIEGLAEGTSYGGMGFRTRPNGGSATMRIILDSGGTIRAKSYRDVAHYVGQQVSVADDATVTITSNIAGALMVSVYDAGTGSGALYYVNYNGIPQIIQSSGAYIFKNSDLDGYFCVFKTGGSNSHTTVFKNRVGITRPMYISVFGSHT